MATSILLVRHGSTDAMGKRLCGRMPDIPLSAAGVREAEALARRLARIDRVVSSPIQRARQTAEILAARGQTPFESMALFTEFDFGLWTGRAFTDLENDAAWRDFNEARDRTRAPEGESMHDVQQRAAVGLRQLVREESGGRVAVVTHADVIRALVLRVTGMPMVHFWRLRIDPASITEIVCGPEGDERIARMNDCAHLSSET